jgi:hypothetical protein
MSRSTQRILILLTGLFTAIVHLVILNIPFLRDQGTVDPLFTLNGLGFLALLAAFFFDIPVIRQYQKWVNWGLLAFTAVTLIAWIAIGARNPLGYITALDEVAMIALLWTYNRGG